MQHRQTLPIYQVDAFTSELFKGNPAAVVPLENWLSDELMQAIAAENNLSETAFFVPELDGYRLRWFTPTVEVNFCGHATLATAHIIFEYLDYPKPEIAFFTKSGLFKVNRSNEFYLMDFPSDEITPCSPITAIQEGLNNAAITAWYKGKEDYMVVLTHQEAVEQLQPDFRILATLDSRGVIVTAPGDEVDFVSRGFFPQSGIDEDPVTGSAHTTLTPYWAKALGKNTLTAKQVSKRGGYLWCTLAGNRILMKGQAVTYLKGTIWV